VCLCLGQLWVSVPTRGARIVYVSVCVCLCVCVCVCVCVCLGQLWVLACERVCVCVWFSCG